MAETMLLVRYYDPKSPHKYFHWQWISRLSESPRHRYADGIAEGHFMTQQEIERRLNQESVIYDDYKHLSCEQWLDPWQSAGPILTCVAGTNADLFPSALRMYVAK